MATQTTDVIISEVLWAMVAATIPGRLAIAGTEMVVALDSLKGKPGDSVKIPKWSAIGEFDTLTEGVAMTPVNLTSSSTISTVKEFGKSVQITELALLTSYDDPMKELANQFARYASMALDKELILSAETTTLLSTPGATIDLDNIIDAKALLEDEQDDISGIVLHPKVAADLMKLPEFKTLTQFAGDVIRTGQIGTLYGMPIYVSRFITKTTGTPDTYTKLIVKATGGRHPAKDKDVREQEKECVRSLV